MFQYLVLLLEFELTEHSSTGVLADSRTSEVDPSVL